MESVRPPSAQQHRDTYPHTGPCTQRTRRPAAPRRRRHGAWRCAAQSRKRADASWARALRAAGALAPRLGRVCERRARRMAVSRQKRVAGPSLGSCKSVKASEQAMGSAEIATGALMLHASCWSARAEAARVGRGGVAGARRGALALSAAQRAGVRHSAGHVRRQLRPRPSSAARLTRKRSAQPGAAVERCESRRRANQP
jgi:hypothetical protein